LRQVKKPASGFSLVKKSWPANADQPALAGFSKEHITHQKNHNFVSIRCIPPQMNYAGDVHPDYEYNFLPHPIVMH